MISDLGCVVHMLRHAQCHISDLITEINRRSSRLVYLFR